MGPKRQGLVFEHEILDVADIAIERVDVVSDHLDNAAKVGVALLIVLDLGAPLGV